MERCPVRIRILHVDGCRHLESTLELVRSVLVREGARATVEVIEVKSGPEAVRLRFLGSPTVQIDGVDVEPTARTRSDFGMACRLYGGSGLPSHGMMAAAMQEASSYVGSCDGGGCA